ncbi:MltA domain-containing protein [Brevundimonas sp.]|uniref:MltA domain-containing protein n=1 Tax=Brevundimonas sp. TaxID=1871086 RepID=UPI003014BB8A
MMPTAGRAGAVAALLMAALVSACARAPEPTAPPRPLPPVTQPAPPTPPPPMGAMALTALPGWDQEDHLTALIAYAAGCSARREPVSQAICAEAKAVVASRPTPSEARAFMERRFVAVEAVAPEPSRALLTSYFAPEYEARRAPDANYDAPVLAPPPGWRRGDPLPDRATIEANPAPYPVIGWMRAEDLFFLQIQGSGYLTFADGSWARAAYAADNGHPFVGIARPMADQGLLPPNGTSGEAIRAWLAAHRGPEARAVMALNPRYIFFRMDPDDGGHPAGAAGIPLPERRAIAVDPAHWTYGEPVWIEADGGNLIGARASYRGLVMALDTGSAIRGPVRADLYMGRGAVAGAEAGAVRHPLRMWRLVPR